ncbi:hypothetical protein OXYTRIMIC_258 [Oxytricha trifallax]|uniref:Ubiquitin-like protease family profile domain-containing protein n=1 Tax=Oxytricha trifallax TaxID=1172189 RepID=A0A073I0T6_9SPIT|nr:hypothetical protein OXYTRIMIC_258 [Oxytricha trifallax]
MEEMKQNPNLQKSNKRQASRVGNYRKEQHYKKEQFWQKVKEIRYDYRDRSRDQEALGMRENKNQKVPLNRQMGFKSRLKIGQSNPSKKINETKAQRTSFDAHEDGTPCIQRDPMELKRLIDLAEVTCQGFDKIIHTKKGWNPQTTRLMTIVCCPSTRGKMEKALIRRFNDREEARRRGAREWDLWTERQQEHWRAINESWQHEDLIPGRHIQEITVEMCLRQIEEAQFSEVKISQLILPPIVMNDKGVLHLEECIGSTNWKLDNSKYWREPESIESILIPVCWQSSIKNCQNWILLRMKRGSGGAEVYDTRRQVGSVAVIQKHLRQVNEMVSQVMGKDYQAKQLITKPEINQVMDPEDCGVLLILMVNHLALEIPGEPIFQIFSKDWINMQRYYLMFNLEVGVMKLEIGKSGISIREEDVEQITEKRNGILWKSEWEDKGTEMMNQNSHIDTWDELVLQNGARMEMEQSNIDEEGRFSDIGDNEAEVESYLYAQKDDRRAGASKQKLIPTPPLIRPDTIKTLEMRHEGQVEVEGNSKDGKREDQNTDINKEEPSRLEEKNDSQVLQ